jgi:pimeloyl-ACP methyl ester carboxylesterase
MNEGQTMKKMIYLAATVAAWMLPSHAVAGKPDDKGKGSYAVVNGLKMYYEIHGTGLPLVLLHGAFGTAEGWATVLPTLVKSQQVIVVELQGHGRTGDIDRPLSFGQMAEDTAALLQRLKIQRADVFGYSMGGDVAVALAIKRPELVRKLAILGAGIGATKDTYDPESYKQFKSMTPENFNFPQVKDPYTRLAPDPSKWPVLVSKIIKMDDAFKGFAEKDVKAIKAQTLVMMGDHDVVRTEHAAEVARLIPRSQLAIIAGGDHFVLFMNPEKVLSVLMQFLDAPIQDHKKAEDGK